MGGPISITLIERSERSVLTDHLSQLKKMAFYVGPVKINPFKAAEKEKKDRFEPEQGWPDTKSFVFRIG